MKIDSTIAFGGGPEKQGKESVCGDDTNGHRPWRRVTPLSFEQMQAFLSEEASREEFSSPNFDSAPIALDNFLCERQRCFYRSFSNRPQQDQRKRERVTPKPGARVPWSCPDPVQLAKRNKLDRYVTSSDAVATLLKWAQIDDLVLDVWGSSLDQVAVLLQARGPVVTNGIDSR